MIRIDHIYWVLILSLPVVDGVLRVRLGAGWEPSIILALCLFVGSLYIFNSSYCVRNIFLFFSVFFFLLLLSNFFGYFYYSDDLILSSEQMLQIRSVEARMLVESIRYLACLFVFLFTYFYLNTIKKIVSAACAFLCAAWVEGLYGIYEFTVKINGLAGYLPLLRGDQGNAHTILRSYGTFFEPSNFGQFMACSFLFYLGFIQFAKQIDFDEGFLVRRKFLLFFVFFAAVLLSFSRTAFLGLFVGVVFKVSADFLSGHAGRMKAAVIWGFSSGVLILAAVVLVIGNVSEYYVDRWLSYTFDFSSDVDYENTALSRSQSFYDMALHLLKTIKDFPLGVGQGMAYLEYPFTPFIIRLPVEMGFLSTSFFLVMIFVVVMSLFRRSSLAYCFSPAFVCLLLCLANYNSTNHVWLWFCFGFFFRLSKLRWKCIPNENFSCNHHD